MDKIKQWCEEDFKKKPSSRFNNFDQRQYNMDDLEKKLIEKNEPKTAGNDETVRRKAEELQERLGAS